MFVGVYFSPNRALAKFDQLLVELGALIDRSRPDWVVVAGYHNAKSLGRGGPQQRTRAASLECWVVMTGLTVVNPGSVDTCVRQ